MIAAAIIKSYKTDEDKLTMHVNAKIIKRIYADLKKYGYNEIADALMVVIKTTVKGVVYDDEDKNAKPNI